MKRLAALSFLLIATCMLSFGCAGQTKAEKYENLYRQSQEQIEELQARLEEAQARILALRDEASTAPDMLQRLEQALSERDRLAAALADAEQRLRDLGQGLALPPELDQALVELVAAYPDLMSYDPDRGMIKFRSDLTFALGSVAVSDDAAESLRRLAEILQQPFASDYEARIVGHTDNVPISRASTRQKHPTNWHLSVHRAISVKDVLEKAGVPPVRMGVAGYGPYRPVVPHKTNSSGKPVGTEPNRRVELFLIPTDAEDVDRDDNSTSGPATTDSGNSGSSNATTYEEDPEPTGAFK